MIFAPLGKQRLFVTADRRAVDAEVFGQLRFQPAGEKALATVREVAVRRAHHPQDHETTLPQPTLPFGTVGADLHIEVHAPGLLSRECQVVQLAQSWRICNAVAPFDLRWQTPTPSPPNRCGRLTPSL